jgi:hypothetical protein
MPSYDMPLWRLTLIGHLHLLLSKSQPWISPLPAANPVLEKAQA